MFFLHQPFFLEFQLLIETSVEPLAFYISLQLLELLDLLVKLVLSFRVLCILEILLLLN
jgi:hypothetical protein